MIKNLKFPDILQVSGLFLLQSDRLIAWVNIKAHGPKHFYQRLEKGKNAENLAYSTIFQSRTWTCSGNKLVKPEIYRNPAHSTFMEVRPHSKFLLFSK